MTCRFGSILVIWLIAYYILTRFETLFEIPLSLVLAKDNRRLLIPDFKCAIFVGSCRSTSGVSCVQTLGVSPSLPGIQESLSSSWKKAKLLLSHIRYRTIIIAYMKLAISTAFIHEAIILKQRAALWKKWRNFIIWWAFRTSESSSRSWDMLLQS